MSEMVVQSLSLNEPETFVEPASADTSDRSFRTPGPFRAMLAICSDLDDTPDADTYFEILRFLNTTATTRFGEGVGLEVGNTIYFDMPPGDFSYWNTTDENRARIRALIQSGHIDCLHSFGDLATTRAHAARALDELSRHNCRLKVWVDHRRAPTNFGADIMQGHGDEPRHPAYHADLTLPYGIEYVSRGRCTSVIGQDRPFSLRGIARWDHPIASAGTLAKQSAKQVLAQRPGHKYALHRGNRLTAKIVLRDGQSLTEFMRCNPCWAGVSGFDRGDGIQEVLTRPYLDRLVAHGGASVLYTHLGKLDRNSDHRAFAPAAVNAFRLLAEYQRAGKILVTTTARLLDYRTKGPSRGTNAAWQPLRFPNL